MISKGIEGSSNRRANEVLSSEMEELKKFLDGVAKEYQEEIDFLEEKLRRIASGEEERMLIEQTDVMQLDPTTAEMMRAPLLDPKNWLKHIAEYQRRITAIRQAKESFKNRNFSTCVPLLTQYADERKKYWELPLHENAKEKMLAEQAQIKKYIALLQ